MLKRVRTVAPTSYPVTLQEVKDNASITFSQHDALLDNMIAAASDYAEDVTATALMTQTWEHHYDKFTNALPVPLKPLISIDAVDYYDTANVLQTLDTANYYVSSTGYPVKIATVDGVSWPVTENRMDAVRVTGQFGYAEQADVPEPIRQAIIMLVGYWYDTRGAVAAPMLPDVPPAVEALLNAHRLRPVA